MRLILVEKEVCRYYQCVALLLHTLTISILFMAAGINGDVGDVWSAIVNDEIIPNPDNPRLRMLPGGVKWIGGLRVIYNRRCYDEITNDLPSHSHVLVIGTPGIGKAVYLQTLLASIARQAREGNRKLPRTHYLRRYYGNIQVLSLQPDGSIKVITRAVEAGISPDYCLSDGVDPADAAAISIEVASNHRSKLR